MRNTSLILGFIVLLVGGTLAGCPDTNLNGKNSLTMHNNHDYDVTFLSVTRIGPIDPVTKGEGINLLPEPVKPGESFRVDNLEDGKYSIYVKFKYYSGYYDRVIDSGKDVTQSLEGGSNYDWYFTGPKNSSSEESIVKGAPTAKAIVNELLGL